MWAAEKHGVPFSISGQKFCEVLSMLHRRSVAFHLCLWYTISCEDIISHRLGELHPFGKKLVDVLIEGTRTLNILLRG